MQPALLTVVMMLSMQGTLCWVQGEWFHCEINGPVSGFIDETTEGPRSPRAWLDPVLGCLLGQLEGCMCGGEADWLSYSLVSCLRTQIRLDLSLCPHRTQNDLSRHSGKD